MVTITDKFKINDIYDFQLSFNSPYFFKVEFEDWKKSFLYERGIVRFDTDTALNNTVAQHYYEKNDFIREGITRSYYITGAFL